MGGGGGGGRYVRGGGGLTLPFLVGLGMCQEIIEGKYHGDMGDKDCSKR